MLLSLSLNNKLYDSEIWIPFSDLSNARRPRQTDDILVEVNR